VLKERPGNTGGLERKRAHEGKIIERCIAFCKAHLAIRTSWRGGLRDELIVNLGE